jgi:hypothetical protein
VRARRLSVGAALTFGVAAVAAVIGSQITARLTLRLVIFAAFVLAGMAVTYWVDRGTRVENETNGRTEEVRRPTTSSLAADSSAASDFSVASRSPATSWLPTAASSGAPPLTPDPGPAARKAAWVSAVMAFDDIADPDFRLRLLSGMGDSLNLGRAFQAKYSAVARDHVIEIVNSCWRFMDAAKARRALAETLIGLRPDDAAAAGLRSLADGG